MARASLVTAILLAFVTSASAGSKVDWSQYIDPNPSAPVRSTPPRAAPEPAPAKAKAAKTKKRAAPKRKATARAKAKPRHR